MRYFTEHACQEAHWDLTITIDNRFSLRTAASNRLSPNTWFISACWPEGYAKILSSFWQIGNHEDEGIAEGKETLFQLEGVAGRVQAGRFFNLAKLNEKKMKTDVYYKEVDAEHNAVVRKAVKVPYAHP